jgi:hypothetical protein
MLGQELAVAQAEMAGSQSPDEERESDFGGIPFAAEHAFGEEGPAERDAIDPAD